MAARAGKLIYCEKPLSLTIGQGRAMVEAVKLFAKTEAILLDPVYSGKAAAGLIDLVRQNHFPKGANVLFLHTGGSPALYAYMDTFRQG